MREGQCEGLLQRRVGLALCATSNPEWRVETTSLYLPQAREQARRLVVELVNHTRWCGETPLHAAAQGGHVEMITTLVQLGANVNVQDTDGRSPLYVAEQAEVIKLVELGPFYLGVGGVEVGHDGGVVPALPQGRGDGLTRHDGTRALTHVQHALLRHQLPDEVAEPRLLQMVQQPEGIAACCATLSRPTHLEPLT